MQVQVNIPQIHNLQIPLMIETPVLMLEEEFETTRVILREGIDRAINDETFGLKKSLLEKVDKTAQEGVSKVLTPTKELLTKTSPLSAPIINPCLDHCVEPTVKKIAKYSTEKSVDKCIQPSIHKCVEKSLKSTQKSATNSQTMLKKFTSYIW